jgi:intracellular sulfur oxidation DsrE/DsrF family protein
VLHRVPVAQRRISKACHDDVATENPHQVAQHAKARRGDHRSQDARDDQKADRVDSQAFKCAEFFGNLLAYYGADVLNVWRPNDTEVEAFTWDVQVGMRSTVLDASNEDRARFDRLLEAADVFFSNRRPGYPYKGLLADLMKRGVRVELCGATAKAHHWGNEDLLPGIRVNTDAMARTAQLVQEGFVKITE